MINKTILILLPLFAVFQSCYYDAENELYPNAGGPCQNVNGAFISDVEPIITTHCSGCHNNAFMSGGISLEGYDNIKNQSVNGKLLNTIRHENGVQPMPRGAAKLSACQIEQIEYWISVGAPNN